jgi:hypothetical protein
MHIIVCLGTRGLGLMMTVAHPQDCYNYLCRAGKSGPITLPVVGLENGGCAGNKRESLKVPDTTACMVFRFHCTAFSPYLVRHSRGARDLI